jgi:phosphatidylinositol alpha-1,6-mannosyltransferase
MLNNEFPPLGGGQGVFNQLLLEHISKRHPDIVVDLITASRSKADFSTEKFLANVTIHRVPVNNLDLHHARGIELIRYALRAAKVAGRLAKTAKYDLCLAFSAVPAGVVALWLKARFGIPYMTRSPGVDIPGFEARYKWLYPFLTPPIKAAWRHALRNIVSSEQNAELMSRVEPRANPMVIPNGVDTALFHPASNDERVPTGRVLCVARLVKRKGVHLLLEAMRAVKSRCPTAKLTVVGTGDEEFWLRELARGLEINESVEFLGAVGRDAMPALYRSADIFALPSDNEGMSNAALEALASGLPLLLTDVGGSSDLVRDGGNGWIIPRGDSDGFAQRIVELVEHKTLWTEMARNSRARSAMFGIEAMLERYLGVITGHDRTSAT